MTECIRSTRERLIGRAGSAVVAIIMAVVLAVAVAQRVAATDTYLQIEHSLPTYDGVPGSLFFMFGGLLIGLAVLSALIDAGLLPTLLPTSGPVVGWAVNHLSAPIAPHYSVIFPLEMAILYGGIFGVLGYFLGSSLRNVASQQIWAV